MKAVNRAVAVAVAAALLAGSGVGAPARADNQMGYTLMTQQEALGLPRNGGALGLDLDRGTQISDSGMTFDVMRVKGVRRGSPAARAGFALGDQIIAVDGRVFPTIASFAAYVGSTRPGQVIAIDYMPRGGGPAQAQRVAVTVAGSGQGAGDRAGGGGAPMQEPQQREERTGLSTGQKVAIGVGAAALFGCYELGCFSRRRATPANQQQQLQQQFRQQQQLEQQRYGQAPYPNR